MTNIRLLRQYGRWLVLGLLGSISKPAKGIHILNGHMIARENSNINVFLSLLEQLQHVSSFIRIEEAIRLITNQKPVNKALIAFTFDDGFEECATMIAPALEYFNTNALFFVNPNFVEGDSNYIKNFTEKVVFSPGKDPMRWDDIKELHARGHLIGAHTMDHYSLNIYNDSVIEYQIVECKRVIESKINASCDYFAFPYGRLNNVHGQSLNLALEHYKYVFSQTNYKKYFSFGGTVINRRHFEPDWPIKHVKYFISCKKSY